jgi:biotin transporter BioY
MKLVTETNISIKDDMIVIIKESIKFALVGIILILVLGTPLLYILLKFTEIDMEVAVILTGLVVAILIVVVDDKKIRTTAKITECNRRIIRKVLKI